MRNPTFIGPEIQRDPTSIASVLRWVCANHRARQRAENAAIFGPAFDIAYDTARALGVTRQQITHALRNA